MEFEQTLLNALTNSIATVHKQKTHQLLRCAVVLGKAKGRHWQQRDLIC